MRPSGRLLIAGGVMLALSLLIVSVDVLPPETAVALWAGLLALAMADLLLSPGTRGLSLSVKGPDEVFSGEPAIYRTSVAFPGVAPDRIEARLEMADDLGRVAPFQLLAAPSGVAQGTVRVEARRRGIFPISSLWLRWPSRFGLWEIAPKLPATRELKVVPNIRPVSSGQIDVTVQSSLYGVKDTATRGEGSEFHQLIDFMPGMDTRTIDWKHSARQRELVAKEMRAERNHQIILALDNGYLMRREVGGLPKIDHAINAALAVAWAAGLGGDLVGLYSFDAEPRIYVPPQPARAAFPALRAHTADMSYNTVESNHTLAMAHLNGRLKRRSLIVVFSDFVDPTTAELLVENIQVLNKSHVIVFVTMRDPELDIASARGAPSLTALSETVVASAMQRERQLVLDRLSGMGVVCLDVKPDQLTPRLVSAYLDIKARELI